MTSAPARSLPKSADLFMALLLLALRSASEEDDTATKPLSMSNSGVLSAPLGFLPCRANRFATGRLVLYDLTEAWASSTRFSERARSPALPLPQ